MVIQENENQKDIAVGAIPAGIYINSKTKREYQCTRCGDIYLASPNTIRNKKTTNCPKCGLKSRTIKRRLTQKRAEEKTQAVCQHGFYGKMIGQYTNTKVKTQFECPRCKTIFLREPDHAWCDKAILCVTCSQFFDGKRMQLDEAKIRNKIGAIEIDGYHAEYISDYCGNNKLAVFKCPCCHKEFKRTLNDVIRWKLIFCKLCGTKRRTSTRRTSQEELDNKCKQYGFTCLDSPGENVETKLRWICTNCHKVFKRSIHEVFSKKGISQITGCLCPKCGRSNLISKVVQFDLLPLVKKILGCTIDDELILEQKPFKQCGGIDILIGNIAIEYDSYYWHRIKQNRTENEKAKDRFLLKKGYKILRIQADGYDLPTEKQLRKVLLNDFQHGCKQKTITMKSWKKIKQKYKKDKL